MRSYVYSAPSIKRPYLFRNPVISQVLSGSNPLRLFALAGRFSPPGHVTVGDNSTSVVSGPTTTSRNSPGVDLKPITIVIMDESWLTRHVDDAESATVSVDFIPTALRYAPVSTITPIKVVGANNPPYHFGGSEDTLVFKIDWYGYTDDPVIKKCRFIESLCKADGWSQGPPAIKIYWGSTNQLFKDHEFVVTKAPYEMKTFTRYKTQLSTGPPTADGRTPTNLTPYHLWPVHATQTLTLKRITNHQLTHAEIRKY